MQQGWTYEPPTFYETNSADGAADAVRVAGIAAHPAAVNPPPREPEQIEAACR